MTLTLVQPTGPAHTRIYAYGAARGEIVVPNEDLIGPIDSSDEWIRQRTGIITRTRAVPETTAIDLATDAAAEAIARSGVDPKLIDAVIVATISNPKQTPSVSAIVADRVGANPAAAYDVNAACAGFSYGVAQADALIRGGLAHYAVVVGAEKLSDIVDPTDRSISFLLGDGAGAVVIGPSDTPGIGPTVWGSDGSKADAVGHEPHPHRVPRRRGAVADASPGGPDRLPLGGVGDGQGRAPGARGRRGRGIRPRRLRAAPGQHAHHRRVRQAAEAARHRRDRRETSRRRATRRRRPSRSRRTGCSKSTPS